MASDYSFRLGTLNTQLDSWIFEAGKDVLKVVTDPGGGPLAWLATFNGRQEAKAAAIAARVLGGGFAYDVIAFNEVFHENARDVLVKALKGTFPYYVAKSPAVAAPLPAAVRKLLPGALLDLVDTFTPGGLDAEDSGLMLFSRFPIELTDFHEFTVPEAGLWDSVAAKGALFVRLQNPRTHRHLSVVATHLQENRDEWAGIRASELHQISGLVAKHMTATDLERQDLMILGDLNVIANLKPTAGNIEGLPAVPERDEYRVRFAEPTPAWKFFSVDVRDTWLHHTSIRDVGATSFGGTRLDLLLHNEGERLLVPQHLTLAYNLFATSGDRLSDHAGLNAEFNQAAPHCTPRRATKPALDTWIESKLLYPGSMQWFRLDEPGTYAFAAAPTAPGGASLALDVYQATDLSRPIGQYKGETLSMADPARQRTVTARKFVMPHPPYYVRVRHSSPSWTGTYAFRAHRFTGESKAEAIVLVPHVATDAYFPVKAPLNADDGLWFVIDFERADSGKAQQVEILTHGSKGADWSVTLLAGDGKTAILSKTATGTAVMTMKRNEPGGRRYLRVFRRNDPLFKTSACRAKWTTNLTILHGGSPALGTGDERWDLALRCDDETNPEPGGSDSIAMSVWVDGKLRLDNEYIGEFDDDDYAPLESHFPWPGFRYLESVEWRLVEQDHGPDDASPTTKIPTLGTKDPDHTKEEQEVDFEGGTYMFRFNRRHWLPIP